jgi:hypothetical protein
VAAFDAMNEAHESQRVIELSEADIAGLRRASGLTRIVVQLTEEGEAERELGYDDLGRLIHRWPGGQSRAERGVFDLAPFDRSTRGEVTQEQFEQMWKDAIEEEAFFAGHDPYGDRFASAVPWWGCVGALMLIAIIAYIAFS